MTAVSYSLSIDQTSQSPEDITVGTLAPNAGDVELRVSLTNAPTRKQAIILIEAFRRRILGQYGNADFQNI